MFVPLLSVLLFSCGLCSETFFEFLSEDFLFCLHINEKFVILCFNFHDYIVSGADMQQKYPKMFTSGRKHENLAIGVFEYADFTNSRNHLIRSRVLIQMGGQSGGGHFPRYFQV